MVVKKTADVVLVITSDADGSLSRALAQAATAFDIVVEIQTIPTMETFPDDDVEELAKVKVEDSAATIVWPDSSRFSDLYDLPNIDLECKPVPLWQHLNQPGNKVCKVAPGGPRSRQGGTSHRRHR